ncbi:uncharacterized protein NKAPD1 [Centroberyx gerrardi]|uniref:uncharacterized protein NKAPD1 n=1 Tax=Centroberyx gerrardi TaxID=166262 RepID=UPI003AACFCB4
MSRVPMGKVLLWNVIRHTDAHNKIQEESEMWKMRDWEKQTSHHKNVSATDCMRGSMHCDRVSDSPRDQSRSRERASGHDDRETRYWTRKMCEFEANDPDRWGHSGFKELYPEEFESDCEEASGTKKKGRHKMKKSKSSTETAISKRSKKSSRKKKKKKKKKDEEEKRKRAQCSSSDSSSDESNAARCKQGRKRPKSKHKNKKTGRNRGRGEDSSSEESDDEGERERRTHSRRKRKQDTHKGSDSGLDSQKKRRRKNWKGANEENSDDSSGD